MNKLKSIRKKAGISQAKLSKKTNIPLRTIQHWELGNTIKPEKAKILADFFGVTVTYLLGYSDFEDETPQEYNLDWMNEAENEYKNLGLEGTLIDLEDFYTFYAMELKEPLKDLLVNFAKSPKENQDAVLSLLKTTAQNQNN